MASFTGYAQGRGFQNIPVRDKTKQIQQAGKQVISDLEQRRDRTLSVANDYLKDLEEKARIEQESRKLNRDIEREYAQTYRDAFTAKYEQEQEAARTEQETRNKQFEELKGFSETLTGFLDNQQQQIEERSQELANNLYQRTGLTTEEFNELSDLRGTLEQAQAEKHPIVMGLLARGVSAQDINAIRELDGLTKYNLAVNTFATSGVEYQTYLNENGAAEVTLNGVTSSLDQAQFSGDSVTFEALLGYHRNRFITDSYGDYDPVFRTKHLKKHIDLEDARRRKALTKRADQVAEDAFEFTTEANLQAIVQGDNGAAKLYEYILQGAGGDTKKFNNVAAFNLPFLENLAERGLLPYNFVDDLEDLQVRQGNNPNAPLVKFSRTTGGASLIGSLRVAQRKGLAERRGQEMQDLEEHRHEETLAIGAVEKFLAQNPETSLADITQQQIIARRKGFTKLADTLEGYKTKTPEIRRSNELDTIWQAEYNRTGILPSIRRIRNSQTTTDVKQKWFELHKKEAERGFSDEDHTRIKDDLKRLFYARINLTDKRDGNTWKNVDDSVNNAYYELLDTARTIKFNAPEKTVPEILSELQYLLENSGQYALKNDQASGFETIMPAFETDARKYQPGNEATIEKQLKEDPDSFKKRQLVDTEILDRYLLGVSTGEPGELPREFKVIHDRLGGSVSYEEIIRKQMEFATAADGVNRTFTAPFILKGIDTIIGTDPDTPLGRLLQSRYQNPVDVDQAMLMSDSVPIYSPHKNPDEFSARWFKQQNYSKEDAINMLATILGEGLGQYGWRALGDEEDSVGGVQANMPPGSLLEKTRLAAIGAKSREELRNNPLLQLQLAHYIRNEEPGGRGMDSWTVWRDRNMEDSLFSQYLPRAKRAVEEIYAQPEQHPSRRDSNLTNEAREFIGTPAYKLRTMSIVDYKGRNLILSYPAASAFDKMIASGMPFGSKSITNVFRNKEEYLRLLAEGFKPAPNSKHNHGEAMDVVLGSPMHSWMVKNGPKYGWFQKPYNDGTQMVYWHFEYEGN